MKSIVLPFLTGCGCLLAVCGTSVAQPQLPESQYYQPLNQMTPPGVAGLWAGAMGRADMHYFQPVQVRLPKGGQVTFYHPETRQPLTVPSPAQAGFFVGPVYRFKISNLPDFPGVELFPTIELVDRLHPPPHLRQKYPIPLDLTQEDIELAVRDQLVTKILYIEQPDLALPEPEGDLIREENIPQNRNLMSEADMRGRPVMILRIGGRIPSPQELADPRITPPAPIEQPFAVSEQPRWEPTNQGFTPPVEQPDAFSTPVIEDPVIDEGN